MKYFYTKRTNFGVNGKKHPQTNTRFDVKSRAPKSKTKAFVEIVTEFLVQSPLRLLNLDVDVWVHLNCALWSLEVYETLNGALMNVELAVKRGIVTVSVRTFGKDCQTALFDILLTVF